LIRRGSRRGSTPSYPLLLLVVLVSFAFLPVYAIRGQGLSRSLQLATPPETTTQMSQQTTQSSTAQQTAANFTVTNPAPPNLAAQIRTTKLLPWQAATPAGIRNASRMIVVRNASVITPPPDTGLPQAEAAPISDGWIMHSDYQYYYPIYPFEGSLTFMSAQWIVPPAPTSTGSLVYWFPGLQSNSHIIQPVLQYGSGPEGGGNYWVLANWWAGCASCSYLVSNYVQVNPGDLIYGSMSWSGSYWTIHGRDLTSNTGPTDLNVVDTDTYFDSVTTLEGYGISTCSQLSGGISFESIRLLAGSTTITPSWGKTVNDQGQCGIDSNDVILKSSSQVIINTADPHWYSYSVSSASVTLGGYFDITLTVTNLAGSDVSQTAQLSFPSAISSIQVMSSDMSASIHNSGSTVNGCYSSCTVTTSYPFAEGSASFATGQTHYITARVYPSQAGQFQVNYKTVALVYGSSGYASDWDPSSGSTDQQQEYVNSFMLTVNANAKPWASIVSPSGWLRGTVTLTATAGDTDGYVVRVRFLWTPDKANGPYWIIGDDTNGADGWSIAWDCGGPNNNDPDAWVAAVALDNGGLESDWSWSNQFGVDQTPPSTPSLSSPSSGWGTTNPTPTFAWNSASDSLSGVASYTYQIDTSTSFNSGNLRTVTGITSTSYTPSTPLAIGTWYWRVGAVDSAGNQGSFSSYWSITIQTLVTTTVTLTETSTSYSYRTTTTTSTSYTSTTTTTSTIPTVTTVVLVPLTVTSTEQSTQFLTSVLTTTVTSYTSTETSTSTIPTTVALVASTVTSIVQSIQYLTSILSTTLTSYTSTLTSTSTIPTVTTVVLLPSTVTSTIQSTQYLASFLTTTVTSYTSTTTSTSTSVVYTTVTASPGGAGPAGAGASSPLAYFGFLSLLAVGVGHRVTAGKGWKIPKPQRAASDLESARNSSA